MSTLNSGRPVVVCCADKNMEAGLHVTLYSMLVNLTAKQTGVRLHLFLEGFSPADVKLLRATMDAAAVEYELCLNQISLDKFQGFRSLHGNYMTYARLLLPGILAGEDRFLYLDSDLVVGTDVAALFQTEMQHRPIAAAGGQTVANALEKPFFLSIGLPETNPYFNAGVLLFNTIQWRQDNWTQRCLEFCQKYPDELKAADQTVLNALLGREYLPVDPRFNLTLYPDNARLTPEQARNKIIHFVGSPKPWDLLGNQLHKNSPIFRQYFEKTALAGRWGLHPRSLLRASRLARSYYKAFKALRRP